MPVTGYTEAASYQVTVEISTKRVRSSIGRTSVSKTEDGLGSSPHVRANGVLVKRLRRLPFTEESRVRVSYMLPEDGASQTVPRYNASAPCRSIGRAPLVVQKIVFIFNSYLSVEIGSTR